MFQTVERLKTEFPAMRISFISLGPCPHAELSKLGIRGRIFTIPTVRTPHESDGITYHLTPH